MLVNKTKIKELFRLVMEQESRSLSAKRPKDILWLKGTSMTYATLSERASMLLAGIPAYIVKGTSYYATSYYAVHQ